MKSVGIIGGLGPETTAEFYLQVLLNVASGDRGEIRPRVVVESVEMDKGVEEAFIQQNINHDVYLDVLIGAAKKLEASGVDFIVIPCNSVHIFIDKVRKAVNIPVLSIIEETLRVTKESGLTRYGLLATSSTLENRIYDSIKLSGEVFCLSQAEQEELDSLILKLVNRRHHKSDIKRIQRMAKKLAQANRLDCVLLACTDLQIAIKELNGVVVLDTMAILADVTAEALRD